MPIATQNQEQPLDLPEPWASQLRALAAEAGVDPESLLSQIVAEQIELRRIGRSLGVPTLFAAPRG